jgi:hypothetical protein
VAAACILDEQVILYHFVESRRVFEEALELLNPSAARYGHSGIITILGIRF